MTQSCPQTGLFLSEL